MTPGIINKRLEELELMFAVKTLLLHCREVFKSRGKLIYSDNYRVEAQRLFNEIKEKYSPEEYPELLI